MNNLPLRMEEGYLSNDELVNGEFESIFAGSPPRYAMTDLVSIPAARI